MKHEHASGPWTIDSTNTELKCTVIRDANGWSIAHMYGVWNNARANESLVAAAPELLRALIDIRDSSAYCEASKARAAMAIEKATEAQS